MIRSLLLVSMLLTQTITADNITQLGSVIQLDFNQLDDLTPGSGVFVVNEDASIVVTFAAAEGESPLSTAIIWDGESGALLDTLFIGENQLDRTLTPDGESLIVARHDGADVIDLATGQSQHVLASETPVLSVWGTASGAVCGETQESVICSDARPPLPVLGGDEGEFARIGRVAPPLAVTVSEEGMVSLWSLESSEIVAEGMAGGLAVFGAINADGTHLAWRDPESTALSLLDFADGQNHEIAALHGDYIAQILLSREADVILGIDPQSARRHIWAWDVESGQRYDLGQYRACERQQPDLAELSPDGSALVIGCDSGVDIWRIIDREQ